MYIILLIYLLVSLSIFWLPRWFDRRKGILLALIQFAVFVFFFLKIPQLDVTSGISQVFQWIPGLGLELIFTLDGLSMIFVLLVSGIGGLVFLYAQAYMRGYQHPARFYFYLFLFTGAMLGLVLSMNLIQLFVFWELTSFLSFFLIGFFHEKEQARKAALQSLFITVFGGLSLLAGIILLGSIVGSYSIHIWISRTNEIREHSFYLPGLILILIGVLTKSAQFPFHFWLPGAMQAPAPVSSFLHSATMVKAGFFLLARLNPALGGTPEWTLIIPLAGVLTMLTGSYFAITQSDIKSILAYTTINALGVLVLLIGVDTRIAIKAALLFLFVHAFYKAALFMVAGMIEQRTGTRELHKLGGLIRYMPLTFAITLLVVLSMAGLPPMLGFIGKELIYEAKVQLPGLGMIILVLGVISNAFMVTISLLYLYRIFLGGKKEYQQSPLEKGFLFLAGPGLLALLSLLLGLFPGLLGSSLIESALRVVHAEDSLVRLKLWHGFNQVFFLSLFTVTTGILLFTLLIRKNSIMEAWRRFNSKLFVIRFADLFSAGIARFVRFSEKKTRVIQHGYHRYYILTIIVFTALLLGAQIYLTWGWELDTRLSLQPFYLTGLITVIILSTLFCTLSASRMATIIAMGVTGYGISLVYMYYSAIDLAITQILAETLIVIVFVLVLQRLPRFARLSSRITKVRDLLIAALFGGIMTVLALKAIHVEFQHPISDFFLENSYSRAFGRNVVNVILVDFRALDTLGEIIVLTVAALGVVVLIGNKLKKA
jgi:multicomponent Na+:H+ antiporter subunit A